jgi:threonine/homoserine/homoserine lactone efflux protein
MVAWGTLGAFTLTCLAIELTPGPNMAYLAVLSVGHGRRAGFAATLGVAAGLLIVGIAAALGLSAIIAGSRLVYEALRWGGILYLLWLAWEGWRGDEETSPGNAEIISPASTFFMRGLVTNLLNPKAGLFYVGILPTFVAGEQNVVWQALTLSVVYVAIATAVHSSIVLLGDAIRPWLEDDRSRLIVRRVLSLLLVVIAIWLLLATRHGG